LFYLMRLTTFLRASFYKVTVPIFQL